MQNVYFSYDELEAHLQTLRVLFDDTEQAAKNIKTAAFEAIGDDAYWQGDGADAFGLFVGEQLFPSVDALLNCMVFMAQCLTEIQNCVAETENDGWLLFEKFFGFSGGGAGGGSAGAWGPGTQQPWDFMDRGFLFGLAGSGLGSIGLIADSITALTAIGVVGSGGSGAPLILPASLIAAAGVLSETPLMVPLDAALIYGENYDEEPLLFRGGGIALTDAILNYATPGLNWVMGTNDLHQFAGGLSIVSARGIAEFGNISDEMNASLERNSRRYNESLSAVDLGNFTYDVARLGWDVSTYHYVVGLDLLDRMGVPYAGTIAGATGLNYEDTNIMRDFTSLKETTFNFIQGQRGYEDAWLDHTMNMGAASVMHFNNSATFMPDGMRDSINNTLQDFVDFNENTDYSNYVPTWVDSVQRVTGLNRINFVLDMVDRL